MKKRKKIVIIGAGGHGKVIADIAVKNGYQEIVFLDDSKNIKSCAGFKVVGIVKECKKYRTWDFVIAIGKAEIRKEIQEGLSEYNIATLIHPNAVISRRVRLGEGTVVMAGAIVNSDTVIGKGCIINTGATIDHDCVIGNYSHISVGSHIAGTVLVGEKNWVGAGAVVSNNVSICNNSMIGAGTVVIKDILKPGIYIGVPAKMCKKKLDMSIKP